MQRKRPRKCKLRWHTSRCDLHRTCDETHIGVSCCCVDCYLVQEILRKTEESRDKAKAKLKAYRDKVAKDRKRFSGASGQMTVVIQKEKALEQERKAMNADMEQLRKELSESQERCARLQRENARLKRDVATKSSIVDRVIVRGRCRRRFGLIAGCFDGDFRPGCRPSTTQS